LKLVVVGKPDYFRDQLMDQAREAGLAERVVFTGFVSDAELMSLYREAALYVYPSLSEGFGLQGLEAMGAGVPVLAAKASCLPEVYGGAAVYFDPHNVKDQAEKIADLLGNEGLRERLKVAGQKRVAEFSWRRMAETTLASYVEAVGRPKV
jgi:glycosyltransferase involved in cell wall biosynthesis